MLTLILQMTMVLEAIGVQGLGLRGREEVLSNCFLVLMPLGASSIPRSRKMSLIERALSMKKMPYPASIRVQESPPYAILSNLLHLSTAIQENSEHSFP